jgi:hypothetical protein
MHFLQQVEKFEHLVKQAQKGLKKGAKQYQNGLIC